MADVKIAIEFVMKQEDPMLEGNVQNDTTDTGGRTRFGIAERSHPHLTGTGFFDNMNRASALALAEYTYNYEYAKPLSIVEIVSQTVANALLSSAVNFGSLPAVKMLQRCLLVDQDGQIGPASVRAINASNEIALLRGFANEQLARYAKVVANNPTQARFINGWQNRVELACGISA